MNPRGKDLQHFSLREPNLQMFRIKQISRVLFLHFLLLVKNSTSSISKSKSNKIRDFDFFVDQATPGFELGKKDLQSPALPLGHAAKMIAYEIDETLLGMGGLINFFFYYASILNPVFLNCLYERNPSFLFWGWIHPFGPSVVCIVSQTINIEKLSRLKKHIWFFSSKTG